MTPPKAIWLLLPLLMLLDGIYGDDDPMVRGPHNAPTPEELAEVPHDYLKRAKRSLLSDADKVGRDLPATFRVETSDFKACAKNVNEITHQGRCGICHFVAGASVISNRWCFALVRNWLEHIPAERRGKYDDQISAFHVAACHDYSPTPDPTDGQRCSIGSNQLRVFQHAVFTGYVTGGAFGSNSGCLPFSFKRTAALPMTCSDKQGQPPPKCTNLAYEEIHHYRQNFRQTDSYWYVNFAKRNDKPSNLLDLMKYQISTYGPIFAAVHVPTGIENKKLVVDGDEMAKAAAGKDLNHAVRIVGWDICEDEKGVKMAGKICWLVANSWGTSAHKGTNADQNGVLMVETGHNLLRIEENLSAPIISIRDTHCDAKNFQTKAIDQAVWIKDGLYLFQAHCTQRLKFPDGTLKSDGPPDFIQRIFVGAPPGVVYTSSDKVKVGLTEEVVPIIMDSRGDGVLIYRKGTGAGSTPVKYICRTMQAKDVKTLAEQGTVAQYVEGGSAWKFSVADFRDMGALNPNQFATINALLYVGQGYMAIFGQDNKNSLIAGVFLASKSKPEWKQGPMAQSDLLASASGAGSKRGVEADAADQNGAKISKT